MATIGCARSGNKFGPPLLALSFGWLTADTNTSSYNSNYEFMSKPITENVLEDNTMRSRFEVFILQVQKECCDALENLEKTFGVEIDDTKLKRFQIDRWIRNEGGGGITCIIQDGHVFEKAGVNISVVEGKLPPDAVKQMRSRGKMLPEDVELDFFAAGVSSVIHPRNPHVPTIHFNFRYFEVEHNGQLYWWFGGGSDMTPYILHEDDARLFHKDLKVTCDKHDATYYQKYKKWCDDYFFVEHRQERR